MQHIPPGYVRILAKIDEIGRATYGDAWCGDQVAERRERLEAIPYLLRRPLPRPIEPLGQGPSSGSGGRDYKVHWSPPSPEQLARNAQERETAQQAVNEAVVQRDGAIGELKERLWRSADIAVELQPDGSLVAFSCNWAYGDAADAAFRACESESGRPVLIVENGATPQITAVTSAPTNTGDEGALPQQPAVEAVTPVAVPLDDPIDGDQHQPNPLKDAFAALHLAVRQLVNDAPGLLKNGVAAAPPQRPVVEVVTPPATLARTRRRNKNEKRSDIARAFREMGWVTNGCVTPPGGTLKDLCQLVEKHLEWPLDKCDLRTFGRARADIDEGKL